MRLARLNLHVTVKGNVVNRSLIHEKAEYFWKCEEMLENVDVGGETQAIIFRA